MLAISYDRTGPAAEVLVLGELPDPDPGPGEVRVRLRWSGINPGDTKKREGYFSSTMAFPRVIPHSDGAGVIDRVGSGVDPGRVGQRVWVYNAQSCRPFGTAAQLTVVPDATAVRLPDGVDDRLAACLGIPGITAHRAVFADGPVRGRTVLVHGALGAVGALATQFAAWGGATVITTVRRRRDLDELAGVAAERSVALEDPGAEEAIRRFAPDGVQRIVDVSLSDNLELDAAVAANGAVIAAYASRDPRPRLDFWPMLFDNLTIRPLGSDDFPAESRIQAAADITTAAEQGQLSVPFADPFPFERAAEAHDRVDTDNRRRVLLAVPD